MITLPAIDAQPEQIVQGLFAMSSRRQWLQARQIVNGDAPKTMARIKSASVDLSFWSPPYWVGKSYEQHLGFEDWQALLKDVIAAHARILRPGGFMVVNIADILCYADTDISSFQADNVTRKTSPITRADVQAAMEANPEATRHELAEIQGCSEQTVQRRLKGNNARRQAHNTDARTAHGRHGRTVGS